MQLNRVDDTVQQEFAAIAARIAASRAEPSPVATALKRSDAALPDVGNKAQPSYPDRGTALRPAAVQRSFSDLPSDNWSASREQPSKSTVEGAIPATSPSAVQPSKPNIFMRR